MASSWDPIQLCDALADSVAVYEPDGTFVYANEATAELYGHARAELVGTRVWDLFPGSLGNPFHGAFQRVVATGVPEVFEDFWAIKRRWFRNQILATGGRIQVVATDITKTKRGERRLLALSRASEALTAAERSPDAVLEVLTQHASDALGDLVVANILSDDGAMIDRWVVRGPDPVHLAVARQALDRPRPVAGSFTERALRADGPVRIPDLELAPLRRQSMIVVPLRLAGRTYGALVVTRPAEQGVHDDDDEQLVVALADRAAVALENAHALAAESRARDAAERSNARTTQLLAITAQLSHRLSEREIAQVVVRETAPLLGVATAAIWKLDRDANQFRLLAQVGYPTTDGFATIALDGPAPIAHAARENAALFLADTAEYTAQFPASAARVVGAPWRDFATAAIPLAVDGRVIGVTAFAFLGRHVFDEAERTFLEVVAHQCAQALERVRAMYRHEVLAEVSEALTSSIQPDVLFERVASSIAHRFNSWVLLDRLLPGGVIDRLAVAHPDESRARLARKMCRRYPPDPTIEAGAADAVRRRQTVIDNDFTPEDMRANARDAEHLADLLAMDVSAYIATPLIIAGQVAGAICIASGTRTFDADDAAVLEQLALRVATALSNAQLYERAHSVMRLLERIQLVTSQLSRARTPAEVAEVTVGSAGNAVDAEACALWERQDDGSMHLLGGKAIVDSEMDRWRVLPANSGMPAFRVLETGEALWIETDEEYRTQAAAAYEIQRAASRLRAFCALPLTSNGQRRHVLVFSFPLGHRYSDEERGYLVSLARQTEQALERAALYSAEASAREQAEAANRAKDEFMAMLGHELRNPLAPIVTALELIKLRNPAFAETKEVAVIGRHVTHLARLVDDLLDISRITRGTVELEHQAVNLASVIARSVEMAAPLLEQRGHLATIDVPDDVHVLGDAMRLAQVFGNLLTNAARYTPPGGRISVSVAREGEQAVISVVDNGDGLAAELLPRVFELFVQGARASDRAQGGLGIGLALVRNLVTMHGGSVAAASDGPGRGSTFTVRLPLARAAEVAPPPVVPAQLARGTTPRRVLVVDDNADAADLLAEALRKAGHEVRVAGDGPGALRELRDFPADVAILDIGLPVMDGYELAARIQVDHAARVPKLVALTGYGERDDRNRTEAAGFRYHFVKPVKPAVVLQALDDA